MRSTSSSHRRLHASPAPPRHIDALARLIDEGTVDEPGHVLVHVADDGADLLLGVRPLDPGTHPFTELAGCTAPPEWTMVGLRVRGTAHHLEGDHPPTSTSTTFLLSRDGAERSVLRTGDSVRALPGPATGTLPDLCRRVLGLPTAPPPPTTGGLWTVAWLDQLVDAWGDPARRAQLASSWEHVASLHPALGSAGVDDPGRADPAQLAALARAHADAWGWERLRHHPEALPLPDGQLPVDITTWMDDGFYARWAVGAFPPLTVLALDVLDLLDDHLRAPYVETLDALLG
jgi:hypothetical protein